MSSLVGTYAKFLTSLNITVNGQEEDLKDLSSQFRERENEITNLNGELQKKSLEVSDLHREMDKENAMNINQRVTELTDTLVNIEKKRLDSQNTLENGLSGWSAKLKLFQDETSRQSREAAKKKAFAKVEDLLEKLRKVSNDMSELHEIKESLDYKIFTDNNLDEVDSTMEKEMQGVMLKIRWANDEKRSIYNELETALKLLEDKNRFIEAQREDIQALMGDIASDQELLEEKRHVIIELREEIRLCDIEITELTEVIAQLDQRIEDLEVAIDGKNHELAELNALYNSKIQHIRSLEKQLGKANSTFKGVKGDELDEMLANYMQLAGCPIPIRRLGGGFYMFGSRKIYAKIMNGKLVIRVGGGYMVIEKFIETYADAEIDKLGRIAKKQGLSHWQELDFDQFGPCKSYLFNLQSLKVDLQETQENQAQR